MRFLRTLLRRARLLARRGATERDMDDEMRFHLDMEVAERVAAGASPVEARRAALLAFGGVERFKEEGRDARGVRTLEDLAKDVRHAIRLLIASPAFTAVAVLTIALGIGATTAIFSAVEGVVLRPLPYPDSDRLVAPLSVQRSNGDTWNVTWADLGDWRDARVFEHAAVYRTFGVNLLGAGDPERVTAAQVTEEFFATVGVAPTLGRHFGAHEFDPAAPPTAVISYGLWQRRFGGSGDIVGTTMRTGDGQIEIIGVLPPDLHYPRDVDVWFPLRITPENRADFADRDNYIFVGIARLAPGKSLAQTRTELDVLARRIEAAEPDKREGITVTAVPLAADLVGPQTTRMLWILLGAVGCILLIACVNVASLLLSRAAARRREFAVRAALGAGRGRLVRQYLAESLVLGLAGGALGIGVAWAGVRALIAIAPSDTPRVENIAVNATVLLVALALSVVCAVLFGLAPALQSTTSGPLAALGEGDVRTTSGVWSRRARSALVVGELALSLVLLTGAGLLLRSLSHLYATDPGFDVRGLLTFQMSLAGERHTPETRADTYAQLLERLRALPGVESAAAVSSLPLGAGGFYLGRAFLPEGRPEPPAAADVSGMWSVVSPDYFETMRIPLLEGRAFTERDDRDAVPVMIVNRAFVRAMFEDGQALGKRVRSWRDENVYREIVGVTDDVRFMRADDQLRPVVYVPQRQDPWRGMMVVARTSAEPTALAPQLREVLRAVDPDVPLARVRTMESALAASLAPRRFSAYLLGSFAVLALVLTTIGVYGVLAYSVAQRTREVGIRMALGARPLDVLRMIVGEAAGVVTIGTVLGLGAAFVLTRTMTSLLFEVSATDPATFAVVATLLFGVAVAASILPARRATRVAPVEAIRTD